MYKSLREIYGAVYLIKFPDGTDVPFRALSYGDFHYYNDALTHGLDFPFILEEEIFRKCVLDQAVVDNLQSHKAGTISSTVAAIMQVSGPVDVSEFNQVLSAKRVEASRPKNHFAAIICKAFPAYKIEDIDEMDFDTFLLRLAQAEQLLLAAGMLKEPIALMEQVPEKPKRVPTPELKSVFEQAMKMRDPDINRLSHEADRAKAIKEKGISPASQKRSDIMTLMKDSMSPEAQDAYSDDSNLRQQMVSDVNWIFKDLIADLRDEHGKKE